MHNQNEERGYFTLPGEAGYEALTLALAEKWGADVIRDSDGTKLSSAITGAGYGIYATICLIRDHNAWIREHPECRQHTFLSTPPALAKSDTLEIPLMQSFLADQLTPDTSAESLRYWQVYDRTTDTPLCDACWRYDSEKQSVVLRDITPWHTYTGSFLAFRIWEEISMYNHITNGWNKERLMQLDPMYEPAQAYLLAWMDRWCREHPETTVVRFTSLFYNFVWIWGSSERRRNLFTDWASYDFAVSPRALELFKKEYGYALCAEDFIRQGKLQATHLPATRQKLDWMDFINRFVVRFARQLVDICHRYGKKAYVFYDDSWVGMEPYGKRFGEIGFDGIIKCVFSGYEARLCSNVKVKTHELRLHPYLFPTGVNGEPSFAPGGDPKREAQNYWISVRRALLRQPVDRIGLGGYLHLTQDKPDFTDYIAELAGEFRTLRRLHQDDQPVLLKPRVAVLHAWGPLRSWTLSGHFHETSMHDLIHINESLSGLPFDVRFISFEDVLHGALSQADVVINAGFAGSAWSGGDAWKNSALVAALTQWVYEGGCLLGVNEPSAVAGLDTFFRMAPVFGVDEDTGDRVCHGRWSWELEDAAGIVPEGAAAGCNPRVYLTDGEAAVLQAENGAPTLTMHRFGHGTGIFLGGYRISQENTRMLQNLILAGSGQPSAQLYVTDNLHTECAYFERSKTLVVLNNTRENQQTTIETEYGAVAVQLAPCAMRVIALDDAATG